MPGEVEKKINIEEVEKAVRDVYLLKDTGIIKLIAGFTISNRKNKTDPPIWLLILGGSSSGKTIMLQLLNKCGKWVVPVDTLTTNTFISGFKSDRSNSLLDDAKSGILVFKDFTTVTSMNEDALRDIMGQLRAIYDGEFSKRTGNGMSKDWVGKVGIIAAGTIDVQRKMRIYSKNGERFLNYIPEVADAKEIGYRAMANQKDIRTKEAELAELFGKFINQKVLEKSEIDYNQMETFEKDMVDVAELATLARSPVEMNFKNPCIVNFVGDREIPGRMAMMLKSLGIGIMMACEKKELTKDIAKILYKVALDSIPVERKLVLNILAEFRSASTRQMAIKLHLTTETVRAWLNQVAALKMVTRSDGGGQTGDVWTLKKKYKDLLVRFFEIEEQDKDLDMSDDDEAVNAYVEPVKSGYLVPEVNPPLIEDLKAELAADIEFNEF